MEIEKVIRILTVFLVVAAFAVKVATHLMFPQSPHGFNLPLAIGLLLCLTNIRRPCMKRISSRIFAPASLCSLLTVSISTSARSNLRRMWTSS